MKEGKVRSEEEIRRLSDAVRETAYAIHLFHGVGYLEKVYENALKHRLEKMGLEVKQQVPIPVFDEDGFKIGSYEAVLIVEGKLIIELKAISTLCRQNEAQLINYLKATGIQDGLLVNLGSEKFQIVKKVWDTTTRRTTAE